MSALRLRHLEPGQAIADVGTALVVVLRRIQTLTTAQTLRTITRERARHRPGAIVYVIEPFIGIPGAEVRTAMLDVSREGDTAYSVLGLVVEGGMFQVATARAFVLSLRVATGARLPFELFARPEQAPAWLRERDPTFPPADEFLRGVRELKRQLTERGD